jgi:hypothetical protein
MSQSIRFNNDESDSVIQYTRTHVADGVRPNRIVLRDLGDKFVVHNEMLKVTIEGDNRVVFSHDSFENGDYFDYGINILRMSRDEALTAATTKFYERSARF